MRKRFFVALFGALIGVAITFIAWYRALPENSAAPKANIRTAVIDRADLTLIVNATGTISARQAVRLSFKTPGLVQSVLVEEGQSAKAGVVLMRQDDTAQKLAVQQAQANLKTAQLTLDQLTAPVKDSDIAVAEANIRAAQGSYNALFAAYSREAINTAQLRLQQAQTAVQDAEKYRKDVGGQAGPDSKAYQLALAQEGQAGFAVRVAELQLQMLRRGPDSRLVAAAQARIAQAKAQLEQVKAGPQPASLDRARVTIKQAELALRQANDQLEDTVLRAPFAGVVTTLTAKPGALSITGVPALILTDVSSRYAVIRVDEIDIGQVQVGQVVRLTFDALPNETVNATVSRVALVANQDAAVTTYDVRVEIPDNPLGPLAIKVGMTASAKIILRELKNVVRVPNLFVRVDRRTNQAYVNLVNTDRSLTEISVVLGLRTDEFSEVISGLNEGDTIGINLDAGNVSIF